MKYPDYVDRLKDFIGKYPYVTIEATCRAESDLWDNPDCSKYSWEFETQNFNHQGEYFNKYLVSSWKNGAGWDVGAEVGFGFKVKDDTLYLRPFINGWVYKAGAPWACLNFGLAAYRITFQPKDDNLKKEVIYSTVLIV